MKAGKARRLRVEVDQLVDAGALADARALLEGLPGILDQPKLVNTYAGVLEALGEFEQAEALLLRSVLTTPENGHAVSKFLSWKREQPQPDTVLAKYVRTADESGSPVVRARVAAIELGRGETNAALTDARASLAAARPELRHSIRNALCALFSWHGGEELAEALVFERRGDDHPLEPFWDQARLRQPVVIDETTRAMLQYLADVDSPFRRHARTALLDYLWRNEGPSQEILELAARWDEPPNDPALRRERIALAMELGLDDLARDLLASAPDCSDGFWQALPVAALLDANPGLIGPQLDGAEVAAAAALFHRFIEDSRALATTLADARQSVALVGNSACELGLGKGPRIDAHDIVIRFNRAATEGQQSFESDYGSKTDVHVLPSRSADSGPPATDARSVLVTPPSAPYRNRDWRQIRRMMRAKSVVYCVDHSYRDLVRELSAPPSNGLRVCGYLASLRPGLARTAAFGFAFTDQLGADAASSHYYEWTKPSQHHNWEQEKAIFESYFGKRQTQESA
jgi:hypothetical protein